MISAPPLKITVLTGGSTPERDVALAGAGEVVRALRLSGHDVVAVDTVRGPLDPEQEGARLAQRVAREPPSDEELAELREREDVPGLLRLGEMHEADAAFLVLHGLDGEGGRVQAVLELSGVRYTGSGVLGSSLAMEKAAAKHVLRGAGIPTAPFERLHRQRPEDRRAEIAALGETVIVKPSRVGSSVGLRQATGFEDVRAAVAEARRHDTVVLIEALLPGREFTVGVLETEGGEPEALGVGEIVMREGLFDYHAKYTPGLAEEIFPADVPESLERELRELAVMCHRALALRHFSRVDFRMDAEGRPMVLEANTLPGMTTRSLLPQSAAVAGMSFAELCDRIARLAARGEGR